MSYHKNNKKQNKKCDDKCIFPKNINFFIKCFLFINSFIQILSTNQITIKIANIDENRKIMNSKVPTPDIFKVNGVTKNYTEYIDCTGQTIILGWNDPITDCSQMFGFCDSYSYIEIEEIDFSNFDFSQVTTLNHMFHSQTSLKKFTINSSKTSSISTMADIFLDCII